MEGGVAVDDQGGPDVAEVVEPVVSGVVPAGGKGEKPVKGTDPVGQNDGKCIHGKAVGAVGCGRVPSIWPIILSWPAWRVNDSGRGITPVVLIDSIRAVDYVKIRLFRDILPIRRFLRQRACAMGMRLMAMVAGLMLLFCRTGAAADPAIRTDRVRFDKEATPAVIKGQVKGGFDGDQGTTTRDLQFFQSISKGLNGSGLTAAHHRRFRR